MPRPLAITAASGSAAWGAEGSPALADWAAPACDALASNLLAALIIGAAGLLAAVALLSGRGLAARLGALGAIGPRSRFEMESQDRLAVLIAEEAALLSRAIGG